jgi:hypothetical protein
MREMIKEELKMKSSNLQFRCVLLASSAGSEWCREEGGSAANLFKHCSRVF